MFLKNSAAICRKDIVSELRTRYAINSLVMFVLVTISIIRFAIGDEKIDNNILNGLLWVTVFFANSAGITRSFTKEEDKETSSALKLITSPESVLLGKLLYNFLLSFALNIVIIILFTIVNDFEILNLSSFWFVVFLGNFGLVASSTIISAIISKADTKGTLYPVLSFPILIPLLLSIIFATNLASEGASISTLLPEINILISYAVVVTTASFLLFKFVWQD